MSEPGGADDSTAANLQAEDIHAPNDQQAVTPIAEPGRRRKGGRGEKSMVPEATFTSYYGRPVVRPSPWEADIPAYLFLGGLAGGSSLLAAGADLTRRPELRRSARTTALVAVSLSAVALIHDLGRPERFHHMLRVAKVTSPMSVGTWILTAYGPMAGIAAITEARPLLPTSVRNSLLGRSLPFIGRSTGVLAALVAPALASYTAVLLTDTATPTWHDAKSHLPFVFVGSAAAASGGMGMVSAPLAQSGPAQRLAVAGAALDLLVAHQMEQSMGLTAEPLHQGLAGKYMRAAQVLTAAGGGLAALAGRRSRAAAVVSGAALMAGSFCTRFGVFHAGQQSARDPRYTVEPQRARVDAGKPVRFEG